MYSKNSLTGNLWKLKDFDERKSLMLAQKHNISPILAQLLEIRKIDSKNINDFLDPKIDNYFLDPFKIIDMKKSVKRTAEAIDKNEKIGIIADYDVDGSTSAAILFKFLKNFNKNIFIEIPDRLNDGYGPNLKIMEKFKSLKISLLFTLDCGTTSFDIIDNLKYKSIDTIVIDHHISEVNLPKVFSIINPNRIDNKVDFYKNLAAVGVTFLFLLALRKYLRDNNKFKSNKFKEPNLLNYLDLVALGTVCDVVDLKNYNRIIVSNGINIIKKRINKGIAKLIDNSKLKKTPNASDIGYIIGPQLNAASRMEDSTLPSKLLISDDIYEIDNISKRLFILNEKRKLIEKNILANAFEQCNLQDNQNIIIVKGENWHNGVLGIIASKISDKYNKPVIVISYNKKFGIGSARSINQLDLGKIILNAKNLGLLISGGGHSMAAGFKVSLKLIEQFEEYIYNFFTRFNEEIFKKNIYFDSILSLDQINLDLLSNLNKLEPFGKGNSNPKFIIKNVNINKLKIFKEKHIFVSVKQNDLILNGILFNNVDTIFGEYILKNKSKKFDIACTIQNNSFDNKSKPQLVIFDAYHVD